LEAPITLDAVLRLAAENNRRIGLAQEKVHESVLILEKSEHCLLTLPGRRLRNEGEVWKQKADWSKTTSEVLLEAGTAWIDLLTARRGEALSQELEQYERKVLERAEKLDKEAGSPRGLVESAKAALSSRQQQTARLHQQSNAAMANLVYLLGLPPQTVLVPADAIVVPIELVDVTVPLDDLVAQAMTRGPSVQELEGLLATIQAALDRTHGLRECLPLVQYQQSRVLSKQQQALMSYEDVRGKLAAGVKEARDAVLSGRAQIGLTTAQIKDARASYRESDKRLQENLPGGSVSETLTTIRALEQADFAHLESISSHNKAQLRLLLMLGVYSNKEGPCAAGAATPPGYQGHP
jgi:outer membrane protein TolC